MKKSIAALLFLLPACSPPSNKTDQDEDVVIEEGDVKPALTDTLYYIYTAGTKQQDTEAVKLIISGNNVEGKMMYLPAEKDWRFGNLHGTKEGTALSLTWIFIQEGIKDSAKLVFELKGNQLIEQSYSADPNTGENKADALSGIKTYNKTRRENFPKQEFDMGLL